MKYSFVAKFNPYASIIGTKPEGTMGRVVLEDYEIECENEEEAYECIVNDLIEAINEHDDCLFNFINENVIDISTMSGYFDEENGKVYILDQSKNHPVLIEVEDGYKVGEFFDLEIYELEEEFEEESEEEDTEE